VYVFSYEPFVGFIGCAINGQTLEQTPEKNQYQKDSIKPDEIDIFDLVIIHFVPTEYLMTEKEYNS